jgi:hypothetical protein
MEEAVPITLAQMTDLAIAPYVSTCLSPPCDITGVQPAVVHYQMTQPIVPVEPHALTIEATQRAADALAESQIASEKELVNEKEIAKVSSLTQHRSRVRAIGEAMPRTLEANCRVG